MCQSVYVVGANEVDNIGQLRALVGEGALVYFATDVSEEGKADRFCLCGVDIPATLVDAGFKVWKEPHGDPMEYHCERA